MKFTFVDPPSSVLISGNAFTASDLALDATACFTGLLMQCSSCNAGISVVYCRKYQLHGITGRSMSNGASQAVASYWLVFLAN